MAEAELRVDIVKDLLLQDTFHFTNCAPQMAGFKKTWLDMENYLLENTRRPRARDTIFSGPVFSETDQIYRNVPTPSGYWTVVAFLREDAKPQLPPTLLASSENTAVLTPCSALQDVPMQRVAHPTVDPN